MARAVISKLALGAVTGGENMKSSSGWRPIDFLLKGLALAVPWGAIELLLREYGHPNVGFVIGLSLGLVCLYAVPPRDTPFWRLLLIGAVICVLRPMGMILVNHWH